MREQEQRCPLEFDGIHNALINIETTDRKTRMIGNNLADPSKNTACKCR